MIKRAVLCFLVTLLLIGCGDKNYTVEMKDGVEIVKNRNKVNNPNLTLDLKEIYTIDPSEEFDNDSSKLVTNIHVLLADRDKNIYLLDKDKVSIKKYNQNGKFITSFGRPGSGPGEIIRPSSMCLYEDSIYVNDLNSKRVVKFTRDGEFIANTIFNGNVPRKIQATPSGKFTSIQFQFSQDQNSAEMTGSLSLSDFTFSDSLKIWNKTAIYDQFTDLHDFYPEYQISDNYIYVADNSRNKFKIDLFDFKGDKVREVSRSFIRIKMDDSDMELIKERFKRSNPDLDTVAVDLKYKFAIQDIEIDKDENIWIKPSLEEKATENYGKVFEIYDSKGIFQNRITIPDASLDTTIKIIGDRLYLIDLLNLTVKAYRYNLV